MSDLTRDDIRQAAEAVGWEWREGEKSSCAVVPGQGTPVRRFAVTAGVSADRYDQTQRRVADAIALLEAWVAQEPSRREYEIKGRSDAKMVRLVEWPDEPFRHPLTWSADEADLPTTAVRAVNRAAEEEATNNA